MLFNYIRLIFGRGRELFFFLIIFSIASHIFCLEDLACAEKVIKHPSVSGSFYPAGEKELSGQIDFFINNVEEDLYLKEKDILGLICPHAGYFYSGQVAAYGYRAIKDRSYDTVVVLAPSHFYPFEGISVFREGFFRTPLGDIRIDSSLAAELISYSPRIDFIPQAFDREHSLEVQLPFLQSVLEDFQIIPIVMGQVGYDDCLMLAKGLVEISEKKRVLIVASTDLSHYHSYGRAQMLDQTAISYIENLDPVGLWSAANKKECELCGMLPVLTLLNYAKEKGLDAKSLRYANSGDATGDKNRVVGYFSGAFYENTGKKNASEAGLKAKGEQMFTKEQKNKLLEIARHTIEGYLTTGRYPKSETIEDHQLKLQRGAFVTLRKNGELRGCIGNFTSDKPLYRLVSSMAVESALNDPRFPRLSIDELEDIDIEISVLTEPKLIDNWKKIRLGVDGVIIRRGFSSGVFLPQVATETGWDLETFLSHLCSGKAGLAADCYKDPNTQIYIFQAIIFSETDND